MGYNAHKPVFMSMLDVKFQLNNQVILTEKEEDTSVL